jgi:hypothetical protein
MASYGNSPYSGASNLGLSLLSGPLGKGIAESDWLKSLLGTVGAGDSAGLKKLIGGLSTAGLGAGVGSLTGKHNILPGAMSGAAPYIMQEGLGAMKKKPGATANDKAIGGGGQTSGAAKDDSWKAPIQKTPPTKDIPIAKNAISDATKDIEAKDTEATGLDKLYEILMQQNDPEYQAMMMAPQMAGAFTGMGQTAAYNQYAQQQAQEEAARRQGLQGQSDQAIYNMYNTPNYYGGAGPQLGFATGGYINTEDPMESGLGPNDRVNAAQPYAGASPQPGIVGLAHGGPIRGNGDGMSDDIHASIDGEEDARVADGEYLVPKATAEKMAAKLKAMMPAVRKAAHPKSGDQIKQGAARRQFIKSMTGVA